MLLLQQMVVLFIYMMMGYFCCKKGVLDERTSKKISWIVVNLANPGLIISSAVNGDGEIGGKELAITFIAAVIMFAVLLVLAQVLPRLFRIEEQDRGVYNIMTVFNNIGFMGFPVISAAFGNEALLYAAIFTLPFNVLIYTYGIHVISGKEQEKNEEGHVSSDGSKRIQLGRILNVGVITCLIATVLYLLRVPVPQFVKTTASGLSSLTAPLSMMVIGVSMTSIRMKELFMDVKMLWYSAVKLLFIPIVGTMIAQHFLDNELLCAVIMIMLATPAASMTVMLAQQYGGNVETASRSVALTTLLSVVTIPVVSAIVF